MSNKEIRIKKINSALDHFSSIELKKISKEYEKREIEVIADELRHNYAFYNEENKIVIINKEFIRTDRDDLELAYVLLYEYFHVYEQQSGALSKDSSFEEDAAIYAKLVFKKNNTKLPKLFN